MLLKLDDYLKAISAARQIHNLSLIAAVSSVVAAKLGFGHGPKRHALLSLAAIPVANWNKFQDTNEFGALLNQLNPSELQWKAKDKLLFAKHCEKHGLAHIPLIYHDTPSTSILDEERKAEFCSRIDLAPDAIFFKPINGAHGYGAFRADRVNERWSYCGKSGTTSDLYDFCLAHQHQGSGWLCQPLVTTHIDLKKISSAHTLSTARVITYMSAAGPIILFSVMKLARGSTDTDNFDLGRSGNMVAPIDIDSGALGAAKSSLRADFPFIKSFSIDPDSGEQIENRIVPYWNEVKELALNAQSTLPDLKSLGWDIAITDQGPIIVEPNNNYSSPMLEVAYGRGLKPDYLTKLKVLSGERSIRS